MVAMVFPCSGNYSYIGSCVAGMELGILFISRYHDHNFLIMSVVVANDILDIPQSMNG